MVTENRDLKPSDIQILFSTEAIAAFFAAIGYNTNDKSGARIKQSPSVLGISPVFILVACMLLASTLLTSCAIPITYHDAATYKNLTDLKAEAVMLVETFDTKPFAANEAAVADLMLKFRKAYEYEKGKGKPNSDTMRQFDEAWKLLNEDIRDYRENGNATLGPKYFREAAVVLGQAFDIAIATENLKNRDK